MKTFLTMLSAMLMTFAVIGCGGGTDDAPDDTPTADADHEAMAPGGAHEAEGGEEKPAEGGEEKPAEGGEEKPAEGGDEKPAEGGEAKPAEGGEEKPAEEKAAE